jgi:hypothetical protein
MQKTIIVVRGFLDSGKSQTIRCAFDELREEASKVIPGKGYKEVRRGILVIEGENVGFNSPGDVADPLQEDLKRLIEGENVGFNSPGDVADPLQEDLKHLIRNNCSVIVCAARESRYGPGKTFRVVERCAAQAKPPFKIVLIKKPRTADHAAGNRQAVGEIKTAVRTAVAEA